MPTNPFKIIGWVWHLYNVPFDKAFGDIKDLSIMVKSTFLVFGLIILPIIFNQGPTGEVNNTSAALGAILLVVLAFFWMGYLPFLIVRIIKFYLKIK